MTTTTKKAKQRKKDTNLNTHHHQSIVDRILPYLTYFIVDCQIPDCHQLREQYVETNLR